MVFIHKGKDLTERWYGKEVWCGVNGVKCQRLKKIKKREMEGCKWSVSNEGPKTREMFPSALETVSETTFVELHSQAKDI